MPTELETPQKGSIRNKIIVAFLLVIILWGITITILFQQSLTQILVKFGLSAEICRQILNYTTLIITGFTILGLVISLVISFILVRLITAPILELTAKVKELTKGNFKTRVTTIGDDELGTLGLAFNQMLDNLENVTVSRDQLTEEIAVRLKIEKELKTAYEEISLTQDKLLQSEKMSAIGQLASGVAHEINNPLAGVLNNVQLITMIADQKREFNIDDFKELLLDVEGAALRCKHIVQSLLDFSRSSQGLRKAVSLNNLIDTVLTVIGHELKLANITFSKQFFPELPFINGDSQLLQQVILNLINNAKWATNKKYGREGGLIKIITTFNTEKKLIYLEISDYGIGIEPQNLSKLFDPFFTTKDVGEGTGLGLAIVYAIIRDHNGTISVESTVNEGTTFKITLPAFH